MKDTQYITFTGEPWGVSDDLLRNKYHEKSAAHCIKVLFRFIQSWVAR